VNWTTTALLSAAIQAGVSVIDSHLLSKRMIGLRPFMLAMGIIQLLYGLLLYALFPWPGDMPAIAIGWVIGASICGTSAALLTMFVLQKEEVSRVVPITHISPIFVAIIATIFLDESLVYLQWLAVIIVVAGAMIITAGKSHSETAGSRRKPFFLLFLASLLAALGSVFTKQALEYLSFWNMYSMAILGTSIIMLSVSLRFSTIRQWRYMKRKGSTLVLLICNEIAALSASVLFVRAVSLGPVSLVTTIMGTRPILVAVYSMVLSLVLPGFLLELPGKRAMAFRLAAILMIVGGLSIIYLT